ncbi:MAG: ROK family protein, partial [Trueperaceae bacterium]
AAHFTGVGLANIVKVIDPHGFVLGGGVSGVGPFYLDRVRAALERASHGYPQPQLRVAELGDDAGVIGAAAVAAVETGTTQVTGV